MCSRAAGNSAVQIVGTARPGTAAAMTSDRSVLRAFQQALREAREYIYIEDQYFCPDFRDTAAGRARIAEDDDLMPLLLAALDRDVRLIVLLPNRPGQFASVVARLVVRRREQALRRLAAHPRAADRLLVLNYRRPVYVHAKVLLVDDEFLMVGSANVNRRSMFGDYELGVCVLDPPLARVARVRLWAEHAGLRASEAADPAVTTIDALLKRLSESALLARYELPPSGRLCHPFEEWLTDHIIDPVA